MSQQLTHCANVCIVLVGCDLMTTFRPGAKIGNKGVSVHAIPVANAVSDDERSIFALALIIVFRS
jgi:hypothetical protein